MKTYEYDSQDELSFVLQLFTCIYFFYYHLFLDHHVEAGCAY